MKYEVLWYEHHNEEANYEITHTREFKTRKQAMGFFNKICKDPKNYGFWVTKRDEDWNVIEDLVY